MICEKNFSGISAKLASLSMDYSVSLIFDISNSTNPLLNILHTNESVHEMLNLVLSHTSTYAQVKALNSEFGVEIFENVLGKGSFDEINSDQIESLKIIYASLTHDEFRDFTNQDFFYERIYEPEHRDFIYPEISTIIAGIKTEKERREGPVEETRMAENAIAAAPIIQTVTSQEFEQELDNSEALTQDMGFVTLTREMSIESTPSNNPSPTQNRPVTPEIDEFSMEY